MVDALVELCDASPGYGGEAVLRNISLCIDAGDKVVLLGKSGAGKSTLINCLFQKCKSADIAIIPQDSGLVDSLTAFHNVYMGSLHRHGTLKNLRNLLVPERGEVERVKAVLDELELGDKLFTPAVALSGGQRQRTALARCLYQQSSVLFADEPVSAVDRQQAAQLLALANSRFGTVVLVLHDIELALRYAKRIIGLRNGAIEVDAPAAELTAERLAALYD